MRRTVREDSKPGRIAGNATRTLLTLNSRTAAGACHMFTRQQYLNRECSHRQYYAQFVNPSIIARVVQFIGADAIRRSTDEHMNDIPLAMWDMVLIPGPAPIGKQMAERGDFYTLGGAVCIAKEAARQFKEKDAATVQA